MAPASLLIAAFLAAALPSSFWIDVPYVRQHEHGCGSASIAMLESYWQSQRLIPGGQIDVDKIQRELYVPALKGIPAAALQNYLERHGFSTTAFSGEWTDLVHHLSKGRPLLLAFRSPGGSLH